MSKNTDLGSLVNYIKGQVTGRLNAPAYTSATAFTGTIAGYLGFDTSGNILTSAGVGFTGSGTTNYISKFTGTTALGNSQIFDDGTSVDIGNTNGSVGKLNVTGRIALTSSLFFSSNLTSEDRWEINVATPANDLYFTRSGVGERMRILSAGNVLINATSSTYGAASGYNLGVKGTSSQTFISIAKSTQSLDSQGMIIGLDGSAGYLQLFDNIPWIFINNNTERMRITTAGGLNINTITTGYTLNAISSTSTQFNAAYKGSGSLVQIMARFMGDTSSNLGIAIGYASATYGSTSGIWATQAGILFLGVLDGTTYKSKIRIDTTTVAIDIPTSSAGLASGQLWNDGRTVKITT